MIRVNILIPKRNRNEYLLTFLKYFNQSTDSKLFDVTVYIGEDIKENINKIDFSSFKNLTVHHLFIQNLNEADGLFCRGHILHQLLIQMRSDYDWVSVIDCDMIYHPLYLHHVKELMIAPCNIISHGELISNNQDYQVILNQNSDITFDEIRKKYNKIKSHGNSQVTLHRVCHEYIKKQLNVKSIYDTSFVNENFVGYGGEDCIVSRVIWDLKDRFPVCILENEWVHIWHERQPIIQTRHKKNKELILKLHKIISKKISK